MRTRVSIVTVAALALMACAAEGPSTDDVVVEAGDGKEDGATETRVRVDGTSVWVRNEIVRETREGRGELFVVRGRASRNVTDGSAFVFDDVKGDFAIRSARAFEVTYPIDDGGLLMGQDHFVRLHLAPSQGRPDTMTARVVARARLGNFGGSGAYLVNDVAPVVRGGRTVWRVQGSAASAIGAVRARVGDQYLSDVRLTGSTRFEIDLQREHVSALAGADLRLRVEVDLAGGTRVKTAALRLGLAELGLTGGDVEEAWPPVTCTDEVRACLDALPDGTVDLAGCGEAIEVNACAPQSGVIFDDVAFAAAMEQARARIGDPAGMPRDAPALVGADRADEFLQMVEQTAEARFEGLFGSWYTDAEARDAAVTAAIEGAIDLAYARPLDIYGEPHPAAPGDLAATRQAIADALLLYLDGVDLTETEFGRSLDVLARQYRARHVTDLRFWREEAVVEAQSGNNDVFIGRWLDPYVEISVDRTTGEVTRVYFEID